MSTRIVLQTMILPDESMSEYTQMYYRTTGKVEFVREKNILICQKQAKLSFCTYFNSFSYDKWKKYTVMRKAGLVVQIQGSFLLTLYQVRIQNAAACGDKVRENKTGGKHCDKKSRTAACRDKIQENNILRKRVWDRRIHADSLRKLFFDCEPSEKVLQEGMLYFELEATEDDSVFAGGEYFTDVEEKDCRSVDLALGICTYKRESYVRRNLNRIEVARKRSVIGERLEVFVADNAKTFTYDKAFKPWLHIYGNPNCGGAGGFTRCMIEAYKYKKFSHILLMDDDILVEWSSIEKTYAILRIVKEEYQDAFIGGAMLRLDQRNIQSESGALWRHGRTVPLHKNYDLLKETAYLKNEREVRADYQAWWYCCFPMKLVTGINLPLPYFVRGDDVEWGLRNMKTLILMNGICVWHEPFEYKYCGWMRYYDTRNTLINRAVYESGFGRKDILAFLGKEYIRESGLYRYQNIDFCLQGVWDFLKGAKFLEKADAPKLQESLAAKEYPMVGDLKSLGLLLNKKTKYTAASDNIYSGQRSSPRLDNKTKYTALSEAGWKTLAGRKKRIVYYDDRTKKMFLAERNVRAAIRYGLETVGTAAFVCVFFHRVKNNYMHQIAHLRTWDMWKEKLF